jgi:hypothetical protein
MRRRVLAEFGLSSIIPNTITARIFAKGSFGELDLTESVRAMTDHTRAVQAGNLAGLEVTLTAQAVALDATFNELARRAAANMGDYFSATEIHLRLGLKAQAQCQAALQTLAEIKSPPWHSCVRPTSPTGRNRSIRIAGGQRAGRARGNCNEFVQRTIGGHP